jgi:endo-alpha-1,4-polygalactosaminidase (GH114 family)
VVPGFIRSAASFFLIVLSTCAAAGGCSKSGPSLPGGTSPRPEAGTDGGAPTLGPSTRPTPTPALDGGAPALDAPGTFVAPDAGPAPSAPPPPPPRWQPPLGATWQWQLNGTIDLSVPAAVYDIDLFDATAEQVAQLHARGTRVVCYVNVGAWEDWRADQALFPFEVLGDDYENWPGERWLDIRQIDKLAPLIGARLDQCRAKGFDAVEPDNLESYLNDTGFPITQADQIHFNRWIAQEAHRRGLAVALKNSKDLAALLQPEFDFAVVENCFTEEEDFCGDLAVFSRAGKPVLMAQYEEDGGDWEVACARAKAFGYSAILKRLKLDAWLELCPP